MTEEFRKYLVRNKERLKYFEPSRDPDYYELLSIKQSIEMMAEEYNQKKRLSFFVTEKDSEQIIANINFTNFVYGVFQACYLGFSIDYLWEGKGVMYEILNDALGYLDDKYNTHRVMANYLPANKRSKKLLNRLGFEEEGYARSYLKINGSWEDHVLTSYIFNKE